MSYGIVICSACKREVHQDGPRPSSGGLPFWLHCEDKTLICLKGSVVHPEYVDDIKGKWCGKDAGPSKPLGRRPRPASHPNNVIPGMKWHD